ncbi:DNA-processing protein DprA [Actinomadura bangladeshensis]|uniref:DNA-processing protein DprA n=1 Tax=Actinomadura bangladeshensis TaxID=453573 RepID=A0A4R4NBD0_9ACTN|nr:DNA-processing protein DprA [Actinomadura bangladeshensis]TDC06265.1 DNA-processing protein DprA [Actinomadura bangladeshensis]
MKTVSSEERAALVALLQVRPQGLRWADITAEVVEAGSALAVWHRLVPPALLPVPGEANPLEAATRDIQEWAGQGHTMLTVLDGLYPERLREVHQAPPVLFARGSLAGDDLAVSVVGSRAASERGLAIAASVAEGLVRENVTVVAGLAAGIDTAAHRAALDAGGRTVAIIGTGINKVYPAANRALHEEISSRGLLLSQFWPDAPPQKHTFLMRNATMSGYGLATVVVEAGEHSGARAQARMAVEHGRPVILTDLVVEANTWARALVGRPGVHVASGLGDVLTTVGELVSGESLIDAALERLVS